MHWCNFSQQAVVYPAESARKTFAPAPGVDDSVTVRNGRLKELRFA